jgi:predicted RNA-binding Zn ribbon-like protein
MAIKAMNIDAVHAAGLTLVGEPIAIDLVNTEKLAIDTPIDLLRDDAANAIFWGLERDRLAIPSELPALADVRSLRASIRSLLESRLADRPPDQAAVDAVNRSAAAAPTSPRLRLDWESDVESHANDGAAALLGDVARSAIDLLTGPDAERLHRCAADDCSMLFVATNARRQWCTAAGCGNRQRVARHASRQRGAGVVSAN